MTQAKKYFVVAIDKFLSGWGTSEGKETVFVMECDTLEEANIVRDNAKNRTDMTKVRVLTSKPYQYYNNGSYYVQYMTKKDIPNWFRSGFFKQ
ncbi:hypothetical protein [Paenibacillus gallinarum]|uniref:Uncharacterized protein n=1 Tax=Paenibacillus gallinarum TaxID=2762232 RepID=A0ABR8T3F0_9BACL|nr:hypothetical protein [Paenibacillus gallinarum]MBD7970281.1 hypothetical protein [Paenibacillus gallinarum]